MGEGSNNGSFPISLSVFGLILESGNQFSKLFGLDWERKMFDTGIGKVLLAFRLIYSPLVQTLGIRKWFLDFISGMEDQIWLWNSESEKKLCFCELGLETFSSGNSESEKKHKFHLILKTETET
ncbi:hypothetical protein C1645_823036 [Glomus cerebriforme]|uniref:Uncharacterized protein n=1 Tax=Glomus cerebriforme TaxID=658196 RepID=A0A397T6L4_9GLOM|nr:hypothetical protein C1645_823036 [Glomus cerebriforme]